MPVRLKPKLSILLLYFVFASCRDREESCSLTFQKVLMDNTVEMVYSDTTDGSSRKMADVGIGDLRGYYEFHHNGVLKMYNFEVKKDSDAKEVSPTAELIEDDTTGSSLKIYSTYTEIFDSLGNLKRVFGTPLVYRNIKIIKDSAHIDLYFFTLNKEYHEFKVVNERNIPYQFTMERDTLFSNMRRLTIDHKGKLGHRFTGIIKADYKRMCSNDYFVIRDTIEFIF